MTTTSSQLTVLVTGATGKQGGAVTHALLERGHKVRAMTRNPESAAARALRDRGVEVVRAAFDDPGTLAAALKGADTVFAMSTPFEAGMEAETRQGIQLVDAAAKADVRHFVFTSVGGAHQNTGIPHFDSKFAVEKHLRQRGLPATILGPVYFMENAFAPWAAPMIKNGTVARPMPAGRKLQQIAVRDIGRFAALVIDRRGEFLGQRIDLASDELSAEEEAAIYTRVLERPIKVVEVPLAETRKQSEDMALMFSWFDRVGYSADIAGLRRAFPEVGWQRYEEWLRTQDLSAFR